MTAAFPVSTPTELPRRPQQGSEEAPRCPPGPRGPHLCGETALMGCGAAPSRRPFPQLAGLWLQLGGPEGARWHPVGKALTCQEICIPALGMSLPLCGTVDRSLSLWAGLVSP